MAARFEVSAGQETPSAGPRGFQSVEKKKTCCGCFGGSTPGAPLPWKAKWRQIQIAIRARVGHKKDAQPTMLDLLVRLYAHDDVMGEIVARDAAHPSELGRYMNPVINFLVNGQYEHSRELERFLLRKCRKSLQFSHRMYWYMLAYASRSQYLSEVRRRDPANGHIVPVPLSIAAQIHGSWAGEGMWDLLRARRSLDAADVRFPEPAGITDQDSKSGEGTGIPASSPLQNRLLAPGAFGGATTPTHAAKSSSPGSGGNSFSGAVAVAGTAGSPLSTSVGPGGEVVLPSEIGVEVFSEAVNLVDALTMLADSLIPIRMEERRTALRLGLMHINRAHVLDHPATYLPFGDPNNRVLRIHEDKSFPLSTKSRVPCFVVFELAHAAFDPEVTFAPDEAPPERRSFIPDALRKGLSRIGIGSHRYSGAGNTSPMTPTSASPVPGYEPTGAGTGLVRVSSAVFTNGNEAEPRRHSSVDSDSGKQLLSTPVQGPIVADDGTVVTLTPLAMPPPPPPPKMAEHPLDAARRPSMIEDEELEHELRDGLEAFESKTGEASEPSVPVTLYPSAPGSAIPSGPATALDRIASAHNAFSKPWDALAAELRAVSPYGHMPGWRLCAAIVKSNDDLRQEQFLSHLLKRFAAIAATEKVPVWLAAYDILATSSTSGLIQVVVDSVSLDSLKKKDPAYFSLADFFERRWGSISPEALQLAKKNFVQSLAAYSMITYILQIKDRHNGNIMLDAHGHIVHIDFGFAFTNSPGGNVAFESAPFKLTTEFVEVMGGPRSDLFTAYRKLCIRAYLAFRKHRDEFVVMTEMMLAGNPDLPCFIGGPDAVIAGLQERFLPNAKKRAAAMHVHRLIDASMGNWRTTFYDKYQRCCVGIL